MKKTATAARKNSAVTSTVTAQSKTAAQPTSAAEQTVTKIEETKTKIKASGGRRKPYFSPNKVYDSLIILRTLLDSLVDKLYLEYDSPESMEAAQVISFKVSESTQELMRYIKSCDVL